MVANVCDVEGARAIRRHSTGAREASGRASAVRAAHCTCSTGQGGDCARGQHDLADRVVPCFRDVEVPYAVQRRSLGAREADGGAGAVGTAGHLGRTGQGGDYAVATTTLRIVSLKKSAT